MNKPRPPILIVEPGEDHSLELPVTGDDVIWLAKAKKTFRHRTPWMICAFALLSAGV